MLPSVKKWTGTGRVALLQKETQKKGRINQNLVLMTLSGKGERTGWNRGMGT